MGSRQIIDLLEHTFIAIKWDFKTLREMFTTTESRSDREYVYAKLLKKELQ